LGFLSFCISSYWHVLIVNLASFEPDFKRPDDISISLASSTAGLSESILAFLLLPLCRNYVGISGSTLFLFPHDSPGLYLHEPLFLMAGFVVLLLFLVLPAGFRVSFAASQAALLLNAPKRLFSPVLSNQILLHSRSRYRPPFEPKNSGGQGLQCISPSSQFCDVLSVKPYFYSPSLRPPPLCTRYLFSPTFRFLVCSLQGHPSLLLDFALASPLSPLHPPRLSDVLGVFSFFSTRVCRAQPPRKRCALDHRPFALLPSLAPSPALQVGKGTTPSTRSSLRLFSSFYTPAALKEIQEKSVKTVELSFFLPPLPPNHRPFFFGLNIDLDVPAFFFHFDNFKLAS